jgi:hypothetical protein
MALLLDISCDLWVKIARNLIVLLEILLGRVILYYFYWRNCHLRLIIALVSTSVSSWIKVERNLIRFLIQSIQIMFHFFLEINVVPRSSLVVTEFCWCPSRGCIHDCGFDCLGIVEVHEITLLLFRELLVANHGRRLLELLFNIWH